MALVVVRCVGCRGASRVATRVLGVDVECPRCGVAFRAIEEATLVIPGPGWVAPNPPPARHWRGPVSPLAPELTVEEEDEDDFEEEDEEESFQTESVEEPKPPKSDHDPHDENSPLPASVFIGLSLLPFMIPIVWLVASAVLGQAPVLTFAAPLALAVATSILCLAVISTIDWTPATQIKGVLVLVVLSYFTGVGLYVLKKDMVDRAKRFMRAGHPTFPDAPEGAGYRVSVPSRPVPVKEKIAPMTSVHLTCRQATFQRGLEGPYLFTYGSSPRPVLGAKPQNPPLGSEAWFDNAINDIVKQSGSLLSEPEKLAYNAPNSGRELVLKLQDGQVVRVVRLYVVKNRVYYLAIEKMSLEPEDDDIVHDFFESFEAL